MKTKVIVASSSSFFALPSEYALKYKDIDVVSLSFIDCNGDMVLEDENLDTRSYYNDDVKNERRKNPSLSLPDPIALERYYLNFAVKKYTDILVVVPSKDISGLYNTMKLVGNMVRDKIKVTVFDCGSFGPTELYFAIHAFETLKTKKIQEVVDELKYMTNVQETRMVTRFSHTFDYEEDLKENAFLLPAKRGYSFLLNNKGSLEYCDNPRNISKALENMWQHYVAAANSMNKKEFVSFVFYTGSSLLPYSRKIAIKEFGVPILNEFTVFPSLGNRIGNFAIGYTIIKLPKNAAKYLDVLIC